MVASHRRHDWFLLWRRVSRASVSAWFLFLFLLPVLVYRESFAFLFDILFARKPVDVLVDDSRLELTINGERRSLPLDGIFQVVDLNVAQPGPCSTLTRPY